MSHSQIEFELTQGASRSIVKVLMTTLMVAVVAMMCLVAKLPDGQMQRILGISSKTAPLSLSQHSQVIP